MNPVPWKNPRVIYTLFLVFLSGAVAGAVSARIGMPHPRPGTIWRDGGKELSIQRFKKELDLTPQQAGEIEIVLDDFVMYYQTLQAQMDDVLATGKNRILRLLREDQKQQFVRMLNDLQAKQQIR
jgi:hypothetical protein